LVLFFIGKTLSQVGFLPIKRRISLVAVSVDGHSTWRGRGLSKKAAARLYKPIKAYTDFSFCPVFGFSVKTNKTRTLPLMARL
jgi:hypothetical protein